MVRPGMLVQQRSNPQKQGRVLRQSPYGVDWWVVDWGMCECHCCEAELEIVGSGEPETIDQEIERRR